MADVLLPPTFLFRFAVPLRHAEPPSAADGLELGEEHVLPSFGELEGQPLFADLRGSWSPGGLAFTVEVRGKKQLPWCRATRLEDSDGLHLWIDTRDAHNIHRASRFCHHFVLLPSGGGNDLNQPVATLVPINRARENPRRVPEGQIKLAAHRNHGGYRLQVLIPAEAITGYDPAEHRRLGFSYGVVDRELGWQTLSVGPAFPIAEDPSLWGTLELIPQGK